ncbi:hypothetical protein GALL_524050 [mine drainage metagenome]|uniref:Uncharacterized protein n=1 Tax=mine drainage metagenome TaxID=410659 RepID=A0A1J5P3A5_9ZZZZ
MNTHAVVTIKALDGHGVFALEPDGQSLRHRNARLVRQRHAGVLDQGQIKGLCVEKFQYPFVVVDGNRRFRFGTTQTATGSYQRPLLLLKFSHA